jgi:uncharacterized protein (TIGR03083 family)
VSDRSPGLLAGLLDDLVAETEVLTGMLAPLDDPAWERPTPAAGWAIRDQVSHLAYFDDAATLAVTQRRHLDDLGLRVTGPVAAEWMSIAQAFAGPPGPGRRPGQFPLQQEDP